MTKKQELRENIRLGRKFPQFTTKELKRCLFKYDLGFRIRSKIEAEIKDREKVQHT
jgi:hypothetical protein